MADTQEKILVPGKYDVICGRGKLSQNHLGNKRYLSIIAMYKKKYKNVSTTKNEKTRLSLHIVSVIRDSTPPGRFLKFNPNSRTWYDVGDIYAREKVSHALRGEMPNLIPKERKIKAAKKIRKEKPELDGTCVLQLFMRQQAILKQLFNVSDRSSL